MNDEPRDDEPQEEKEEDTTWQLGNRKPLLFDLLEERRRQEMQTDQDAKDEEGCDE